MDEFVYNSVTGYFKVLEKVGYCSYSQIKQILVLIFYYRLLFEDYRGYVTEEDYHLIEKALNCLYGTTCLIPYPDFLKNSNWKLTTTTDLVNRVKAIENTEVLKTSINIEEDTSDINIV